MHERAAAENQRVEFGCSMEQPYFLLFYNTYMGEKVVLFFLREGFVLGRFFGGGGGGVRGRG